MNRSAVYLLLGLSVSAMPVLGSEVCFVDWYPGNFHLQESWFGPCPGYLPSPHYYADGILSIQQGNHRIITETNYHLLDYQPVAPDTLGLDFDNHAHLTFVGIDIELSAAHSYSQPHHVNEGVWEIGSDNNLTTIYPGVVPYFYNAGTFRKSGGQGISRVDARFEDGGGTIEAQSGVLEFVRPVSFNSTRIMGPGQVRIAGGGSFNALDPASTNLELAGGAYSAPYDRSLAGQVLWSGGEFAGGFNWFGSISQPDNSVLTLAVGGNHRIAGGAYFGNQATIQVIADGLVLDGDISNVGTFLNYGVFRKAGGAGVTQVGRVRFSGYGKVEAQSGVLEFTYPVDFWGGTRIMGPGQVRIAGGGSFAGIDPASTNLELAGGTYYTNNSALTGQVLWSGGEFAGHYNNYFGSSSQPDNSVLTLAVGGNQRIAQSATLTNQATTQVLADGLVLDGDISNVGTFLNYGVFRKAGGAGVTQVGRVRFSGYGKVEAQSGVLEFTYPVDFWGGTRIMGPGQVRIAGGGVFQPLDPASTNLELAGGTYYTNNGGLTGQVLWSGGEFAGYNNYFGSSSQPDNSVLTLVPSQTTAISGQLSIEGRLRGQGTIAGTEGTLSIAPQGELTPGESIGRIDLAGRYSQAGSLIVEIAADRADQLHVGRTAILAGPLIVRLADGFNGAFPAGVHTFDLLIAADIQGDFTSIQLPTLPSGISARIELLPGAGAFPDRYRLMVTNDDDCQAGPLTVGPIDYGPGTHSLASEQGIATQGAVQLLTGANVTFRAPRLRFGPGFRVTAGARFQGRAEAVTCSTAAGTPIPSAPSATPTAVSGASPAAPLSVARAGDLPAWLQALLTARGVDLAALAHALLDRQGQWLVFETVQALDPTDGNGVSDLYRLDLVGGALALLSRTPQGTAGHGPSRWAAADALGDWVVFESEADDLVTDDDNGVSDIFLHEVSFGRTRRITATADGASAHPALDAAGQDLLYDQLDGAGRRQVLADTLWGTSAAAPFGPIADGADRPLDGHHPAISADGRYVAYLETPVTTDRTGDPTDCQVHVHDRDRGSDQRLACPDALATGSETARPHFSDDGAWVEWSMAGEEVPVAVANPLVEVSAGVTR